MEGRVQTRRWVTRSESTTARRRMGADTPGRGTNVALLAVAPFAPRVRTDGAQEVDTTERRPQRIAEVELRMHALPEQEAGQPLLARGTDHEIRIRLTLRVEVLGDVVDLEGCCDFFQRLAPVSYTHLRAHETGRNLVCRLLLEKKKQN